MVLENCKKIKTYIVFSVHHISIDHRILEFLCFKFQCFKKMLKENQIFLQNPITDKRYSIYMETRPRCEEKSS